MHPSSLLQDLLHPLYRMPQVSHLKAHRPLLTPTHRLSREEVCDCVVSGKGGRLFRSIHLGNRQFLERTAAVRCDLAVCWLDCRCGNGKRLFFQWIFEKLVHFVLLPLELRLEIEDGLSFLRDLQREESLEGTVPLVSHVTVSLGKHCYHLPELLCYAPHLLQDLLEAGVRTESVAPQQNPLVSHLTLVLLPQGLSHLPGSRLWIIFMDLSEDSLEEGLVFAELTRVQIPQRLLAGQASLFASFPILRVEREYAFFGKRPLFLLELETVELAALRRLNTVNRIVHRILGLLAVVVNVTPVSNRGLSLHF